MKTRCVNCDKVLTSLEQEDRECYACGEFQPSEVYTNGRKAIIYTENKQGEREEILTITHEKHSNMKSQEFYNYCEYIASVPAKHVARPDEVIVMVWIEEGVQPTERIIPPRNLV